MVASISLISTSVTLIVMIVYISMEGCQNSDSELNSCHRVEVQLNVNFWGFMYEGDSSKFFAVSNINITGSFEYITGSFFGHCTRTFTFESNNTQQGLKERKTKIQVSIHIKWNNQHCFLIRIRSNEFILHRLSNDRTGINIYDHVWFSKVSPGKC